MKNLEVFMSKVVEAFSRIVLHVDYDNDNYDIQMFEDDCKIVEKAFDKMREQLEESNKFKALLEKYEIKDIEALEALIKDYDGMAKAFVQHVLGIEIEVKS